MKRRRIDFYYYSIKPKYASAYVPVLEEYKDYFLVEWDCDFTMDLKRQCLPDGTTKYRFKGDKIYRKSACFTWKPHEYRQEARESCLFAYWFLKRRLGKDPAGIIAKFVWSTRFEEIWENEEEEKN